VEGHHLQQVEQTSYWTKMALADQSWDEGVTGSGVKVCAVDPVSTEPMKHFSPVA
jgi:hypothetical protein